MKKYFAIGEKVPVICSNWPYLFITPYRQIREQEVTNIMMFTILGKSEYGYFYEFNYSGVFYELKSGRRDKKGKIGFRKRKVFLGRYLDRRD